MAVKDWKTANDPNLTEARMGNSASETFRFASVDPAYRHYAKMVTSRETLDLPGARLKWYEIAKSETPVPESIRLLATSFLMNQAASSNLECVMNSDSLCSISAAANLIFSWSARGAARTNYGKPFTTRKTIERQAFRSSRATEPTNRPIASGKWESSGTRCERGRIS